MSARQSDACPRKLDPDVQLRTVPARSTDHAREQSGLGHLVVVELVEVFQRTTWIVEMTSGQVEFSKTFFLVDSTEVSSWYSRHDCGSTVA